MTRKVAQQRSSAARRRSCGAAALRTAAAVAAGLALVVGAAGAGQAVAATPGAGGAKPAPGCGGPALGTASAAAAPAAQQTVPEPSAPAVGSAAQKVSFGVDSQLPIGLWSSSAVTLRTPVSKGTVRLDVSSRGFSTDSLVIQRYDAHTHRWADLDTKPGGGSWPTRGVFTFPVTAADAGAKHPRTIALRLQDLDRPGTLTVAASVSDGHGHTYRAPARTTTATRPEVTVSGWQRGTTLTRGGAARSVTVTVKNTTNRAYPALGAGYFAYGAGTSHALAPKDLKLSQYRPGRGWVHVPLVAGGCDPGMSAVLHTAKEPLAPGASAVYRLKVAVAGSAPRDVTKADAGLSVGNGDQTFFSQDLSFAIRAGK